MFVHLVTCYPNVLTLSLLIVNADKFKLIQMTDKFNNYLESAFSAFCSSVIGVSTDTVNVNTTWQSAWCHRSLQLHRQMCVCASVGVCIHTCLHIYVGVQKSYWQTHTHTYTQTQTCACTLINKSFIITCQTLCIIIIT